MSNFSVGEFSEKLLNHSGWLVVRLAALFLLSIYFFLLWGSWPLWQEKSLFGVLFSAQWQPLLEPPQTGILTMFAGTLWCAFGALLIAAPFGIGAGVFLAEFAPRFLAGVIQAAVQLLTGIPSVVYGFLGGALLVPFFQRAFQVSSGESLFCASLLLAVMVIPYIVSGTYAALRSLPEEYRQSVLALGISRCCLVRRVLLPLAWRKIVAVVTLAFGRAAGETMAVLMVAGNTLNLPLSWWDKGETLSALIALELGSAAVFSPQWRGLFAAGFVLLLLVTMINLAAQLYGAKVGDNRLLRPTGIFEGRWADNISLCFFCGSAFLLVAVLSGIFGHLFCQGWPALSWEFLSGSPKGLILGSEGGVFPALLGSCALLSIAVATAFPAALLSAIYFCEYSKGSRFDGLLYLLISGMAGLPSILTGLFGYSVFVVGAGFGISLISGGLTLAIMIFPTLVILLKNALSCVAKDSRAAALALGVSKAHMMRRILLPAAVPGISGALLLAAGHAIGATAPILITAAVIVAGNRIDLAQPVMALPYHLHMLFSQAVSTEKAYATALLLVGSLIFLNLAALFCKKIWNKEGLCR